MGALILVELTRLRWRRAVAFLGLAAVLIPAFAVAVTIVGSSGDDAYYGTQYDDYRPHLDLADQLTGTLPGVASIVGVLVLLTAITFAGHDWATGSISNQLLFEPRRLRVWSAKAVVVLAVALIASLVVQVAAWLVLYLVARSQDGLSPGVLQDGFEQIARTAILTAVVGGGGYALTMLLRSTVGVLGTVVAVAIVVPLLLTRVGFPLSAQLAPNQNAAAIVFDGQVAETYEDGCGVVYYDGSAPDDPISDTPENCSVLISQTDGWVYAALVLTLLGVASAASFRRRDLP